MKLPLLTFLFLLILLFGASSTTYVLLHEDWNRTGLALVGAGQNCGNHNNGSNNFNPKCTENGVLSLLGWNCQDKNDIDVCAVPQDGGNGTYFLLSDNDNGGNQAGLNYTINTATACGGNACSNVSVAFPILCNNFGSNASRYCAVMLFERTTGKVQTLLNITIANTSGQGYKSTDTGFHTINEFYQYNRTICYGSSCNQTFDLLFTMWGEADGQRMYIGPPTVITASQNPPSFSQSCPVVSSGPYNDTNANWTLNCDGIISDVDGDNIYNFTYYNSSGKSLLFGATFNEENATNLILGNAGNITPVGIFYNATGGYDGSGAYFFKGNGSTINFSSDNIITQDNQSFSLALWFKPYELSTGYGNHLIENRAGGNGFEFYVDNSVVKLQIWNSTNTGTACILTTGKSVSLNKYYWVGFTVYPNGTTTVYENGTALVSGCEGGISTRSSLFLLGASYGWNSGANSPRRYNGTIDNVKMWNYTLNSQEMMNEYLYGGYVLDSSVTSNGEVWQANTVASDGIYSATSTTAFTILNDSCNVGDVVPYENMPISTNTRLCAGTYLQNDSDVNGSLVIRGNNIILDMNGATLRGNGTSNSYGIWSTTSSTKNITIKNGIIEKYHFNIYYRAGSNITFSNMTIRNATSRGITCTASPCGNLTIIDSTFSNNNNAIYLEKVNNSYVARNNISGHSSTALTVALSWYSLVENNKISSPQNASNTGIAVITVGGNSSVIGNSVTGYSYGIRGEGNNPYLNFSLNNVSEVGLWGISIIEGANNSVIDRNKIVNTYWNSIHFGSWNNIISNNYLENAYHFYIDAHEDTYVLTSGNTTIFGNNATLTNPLFAPGVGMLIESSEYNFVYNNIFSHIRNDTETIFDRGSGITVEGNVTIGNVITNNTFINISGFCLRDGAITTNWSYNNLSGCDRAAITYRLSYHPVQNVSAIYINNTKSNGLNYYLTANTNASFYQNGAYNISSNATLPVNAYIYSLSSPFDDVRNVSNGVLLCSNAQTCNVTLLANQQVEVGDFGSPIINLTSPVDGATVFSSAVPFAWQHFNLSYPGFASWCAINLNGVVVVNTSDSLGSSGSTINYGFNVNDYGTYSWNVTCADNVTGIPHTSVTRQFTFSAGGGGVGGGGGVNNPPPPPPPVQQPDVIVIEKPRGFLNIPGLDTTPLGSRINLGIKFRLGAGEDVIKDFSTDSASSCVSPAPVQCQVLEGKTVRVKVPLTNRTLFTRFASQISVDGSVIPLTVYDINLLWFLEPKEAQP